MIIRQQKRLIKKAENIDVSKFTDEQVIEFIDNHNLTPTLSQCIREYLANINNLQIQALISFSIANQWQAKELEHNSNDINTIKEYVAANYTGFGELIAIDPIFWNLVAKNLQITISNIDCEFTDRIMDIIIDEDDENNPYYMIIVLTLSRIIPQYNNIDGIIKNTYQIFNKQLKSNNDADQDQIDDVINIFTTKYFESLNNNDDKNNADNKNETDDNKIDNDIDNDTDTDMDTNTDTDADTNVDNNTDNNTDNDDTDVDTITEELSDVPDTGINIQEIKNWNVEKLQQSNTDININQIIINKLSTNIQILTVNDHIYGALGKDLLENISFENEDIDTCIELCKDTFINNYDISQILQIRNTVIEDYNDPLINAIFNEYYENITLPINCTLYNSIASYIKAYLNQSSTELNSYANNIKALITLKFDILKTNPQFLAAYQDAINDYDDRRQEEVDESNNTDVSPPVADINDLSVSELFARFPKFNIYMRNLFKKVMLMFPSTSIQASIIKDICKSILSTMKQNKQINKNTEAEEFFHNFQKIYYRLPASDIYNFIHNNINKQYISIASYVLYQCPYFRNNSFKKEYNIVQDLANYIQKNIKQQFMNNADSNKTHIIQNILNVLQNKDDSPFKRALKSVISDPYLRDQFDFHPDFLIKNPFEEEQNDSTQDHSKKDDSEDNIQQEVQNVSADNINVQNASNWSIQELFAYAKSKNIDIDNIIQQQYNNINVFLSTKKESNELNIFIKKLQRDCCQKLINDKVECTSPEQLSKEIKNIVTKSKYNNILSLRQQIIQNNTKSDPREDHIPNIIFKELQITDIAYNAPVINALIQYIDNNSNKFSFEPLLQTKIYDMVADTDAGGKINVIFLRYFPQLFPQQFQAINTIERLVRLTGKSQEKLDQTIQKYCNDIKLFMPDDLKAKFERVLLNRLIKLNDNKQFRKSGGAIWNDLIEALEKIQNKQGIDYNTILINCRNQILDINMLQKDPLLRAIMNDFVHNFPYDNDIQNEKSPVKLLYNYIFPDQANKRKFTFDNIAANIFNYISINISNPDEINNNELFWNIINTKIFNETNKQQARDATKGKESIKTFEVHPDTPEKFRRQKISNPEPDTDIDLTNIFDASEKKQKDNIKQENVQKQHDKEIDDIAKAQINFLTVEEFNNMLNNNLYDIIQHIVKNNIYSFLPKELIHLFINSLSQFISAHLTGKTFASLEELRQSIKEKFNTIDYTFFMQKRTLILSPKYNTTNITNPIYNSVLELFNSQPFEYGILPNSKLAAELLNYIEKNKWNFKENINKHILPLLLTAYNNRYLKSYFSQFITHNDPSEKNKEESKQKDKIEQEDPKKDVLNNDEESEQKENQHKEKSKQKDKAKQKNIEDNINILNNDEESKQDKKQHKKEQKGRIHIDNWTVQQLINNINCYKFINKEMIQNEIVKAAIGCIESNKGYEKGYEFIFKPLFEGELKNADDQLRIQILKRVELHNLILNDINRFKMMCNIFAFNLSDNTHIYLLTDINRNNKLIAYIRQELNTPKIINQLQNRLFFIYNKYKQSYNYNNYVQSFPSITEAANITDEKGDVRRYKKDTSAVKEKVIIVNNNIYTGNINETYQDILYKLPIDNQFKNLNNCAYGFITTNNCIFLHPLNNYLEEDIIQAVNKSNLNIKKVYLTINNNKDFVTERRLAKCYKIKRYIK